MTIICDALDESPTTSYDSYPHFSSFTLVTLWGGHGNVFYGGARASVGSSTSSAISTKVTL